ncbi:EAL domain-containing protein [Sulfurimonas sp. HSL1-2]|uniref:bifunctional diguanylate cyclase/phosphodiesterase n=1 Tax=Thiomicrolovo zhangzhouensis TaxID=3131933 RepID=UPI0031F96C9F
MKSPTENIIVGDYQEILELQNVILEKVAEDASKEAVLEELCRLQEKMVPGSVASIMLLNADDGKLYVEAAPSLPKGAINTLDGLLPGPRNGSCANVVLQNEPQFVCDISSDERWQNVLEFAQKFGLNACWSMPVVLEGKTVGTFALTSFEERAPSLFHKMLLTVGARIVSIVLKREQNREKLSYLAFHDPLTGLVNRVMLEERLKHMIARSERTGKGAALFFIDLDRFKFLNDTYGHATGDRLLVEVAKRLGENVRNEDTVARFGGDEFVLLFEEDEDRDEVLEKAQRLIDAFSEPFQLAEQRFHIYGSIGIAMFPADGKDAQCLLKHADTAMYQAKQAQDHIRFYTPQMSEQSFKSLVLEKELREAISNNEFVVYYQPVFEGSGTSIRAAEALVRWQHPERGLLLPSEFIPFAEETGLISRIDEMVLTQVIADLRRWHAMAINRIIPLSVNISGRHINEKDVTRLTEILNRSALARDYIGLELTETYLMQFAEETVVQLERLKHAGVRLAMDDFGSGYSSLGYLKRFKIDTLKIDQLLVRDIVENPDDRSIAEAIIKMGHSLGLQIVAEGVETLEQLELLKTMECDALQGFYFDRALPPELFETKYLRRRG